MRLHLVFNQIVGFQRVLTDFILEGAQQRLESLIKERKAELKRLPLN